MCSKQKRERQESKSALTVGETTGMKDQGVIEATGALSAVGFPALFLVVSVGLAYGALGESGLSLVWSGLRSVGVFRGSLAVMGSAALGCVAAVGAVRIAGLKGVAAGAGAAAAGASVSAVISAIVAAETARRIRAKLESAAENLILTVGCGVLCGMGMSFIFGQRSRNGERTNRRREDEEEDHEMTAEDEQGRKKRNKKKKICD